MLAEKNIFENSLGTSRFILFVQSCILNTPFKLLGTAYFTLFNFSILQLQVYLFF